MNQENRSGLKKGVFGYKQHALGTYLRTLDLVAKSTIACLIRRAIVDYCFDNYTRNALLGFFLVVVTAKTFIFSLEKKRKRRKEKKRKGREKREKKEGRDWYI